MSYHTLPLSVKPPQSPVSPKEKHWSPSRIGWLCLAWNPLFSARLFHRLTERFGLDGGWDAWCAPIDTWKNVDASKNFLEQFSIWRKRLNPETLIRRMDAESISLLLPSDASYPDPLRHCPNPPGPLFWRGALFLPRTWIAVVGTRRITAYGRQATQKIVRELCDGGAGIISGLAAGVDGMAHQTALDSHSPTIAVLAGGIDDASYYPRMHTVLARNILNHGGSILSESPPGTRAPKHAFPQRNRIIAGLAQATVVLEAGERSGSVITAFCALDAGREVFSVPGPITNPMSIGTNNLLKKGAIPCTSGSDVLRSCTSASTPLPAHTQPLTDTQIDILRKCQQPLLLEDLAQSCDLSLPSTASVCMELELCGALSDIGGKHYQTNPSFFR